MSEKNLIPVISFTGGIGSGKSSVANWLFTNHQAVVIDADKIGHDVLKYQEVKDELRNQFGSSIFDAEGEIDRKRLGQLVFGSTQDTSSLLADLEKITHPRIRAEIINQINRAREKENCKLIILDAAVLLKAGWTELCDYLIFVEVPEELRLKRVQENRNWTEEEFRLREGNQIPVSRKKELADLTIRNDHSIENAGKQVVDFLDSLPVDEPLK